VVESLRATADVVDDTHTALAEESECILRWLEEPGTRLVLASDPWAMPAHGAGGLRTYLSGSREGADPLADRRRLSLRSRPARPKLTA
jgi:DNA polymerase-3 subunit epsilon